MKTVFMIINRKVYLVKLVSMYLLKVFLNPLVPIDIISPGGGGGDPSRSHVNNY